MKRLDKYDVFDVPAQDIKYDKHFNVRGDFRLIDVKPLAESIEAHGLDIPVIVRPFGDPLYHLVAGHRRFMAMTKILKWQSVPANIRQLTDEAARSLNYSENLERKDLNMLEEAQGLERTFAGLSDREAARRLGKTQRWVRHRRMLLKLPEDIQRYAVNGWLSAANVELIYKEHPRRRIALAHAICSVKEKGKTRSLAQIKQLARIRQRRTKGQMTRMIQIMNGEFGIIGLPLRVVAWCAGEIEDDELLPDIVEYANEHVNDSDA